MDLQKQFNPLHPKQADIEVQRLHQSVCIHLGLAAGSPTKLNYYLGFVLCLSELVQSFIRWKNYTHVIRLGFNYEEVNKNPHPLHMVTVYT